MIYVKHATGIKTIEKILDSIDFRKFQYMGLNTKLVLSINNLKDRKIIDDKEFNYYNCPRTVYSRIYGKVNVVDDRCNMITLPDPDYYFKPPGKDIYSPWQKMKGTPCSILSEENINIELRLDATDEKSYKGLNAFKETRLKKYIEKGFKSTSNLITCLSFGLMITDKNLEDYEFRYSNEFSGYEFIMRNKNNWDDYKNDIYPTIEMDHMGAKFWNRTFNGNRVFTQKQMQEFLNLDTKKKQNEFYLVSA
ncbi:hypothetical protein ACFL1H_02555 [Nanoarchaeota archaeon]